MDDRARQAVGQMTTGPWDCRGRQLKDDTVDWGAAAGAKARKKRR